MGRPVVHWELMSKDPAKVAAPSRKKVEAGGGKIHVKEQKIPGMGRFAGLLTPCCQQAGRRISA